MNKCPLLYPSAQPGQNVTEYSIVIGLVVLLALPILMNFGEVMQNMFGSSAYSPPLARKSAKTLSKAALKFEKYTSTETLGPYQATYDARTGQITYQVPESMGGGSVTTSVDGATSEMAIALRDFMQFWRGPNGEKPPNDLMAMVTELSKLAEKMSTAQAKMNKENEGCKKLGCANTWGLIYLTKDYNNAFNQVMRKAQELGSGYQEVQDVVSGYSGVISTVNYSNYLKNSYQYSSGINQQVYDLVEGNSHFGQTVRLSVSTAESPVITNYAGKQIGGSIHSQ